MRLGLETVGFCGDCLNTGFKLQALRPSKAQVAFATATGPRVDAHSTSTQFIDFLKAVGIESFFAREIPGNRGLALCLAQKKDDGEKVYEFHGRRESSARLLFIHGDPDQYCQQLLEGSDILHTSLIAATIFEQSVRSRQKLIDLFAEAKKQGKQTIFDTNYRKGLSDLWTGGTKEAAQFSAAQPGLD